MRTERGRGEPSAPDRRQALPDRSGRAGSAQTAGSPKVVRAAARRTREFRRFLAAGATTTVLDYLLFVGLARLARLPLEWVWVAKLISGTVAISISFYLNRVWVFGVARASLGQAIRFVTTVAVGVYLIQTPLTQVFAASYPALGEITFDLVERATADLVSEAFVIQTVAFALATVPTLMFNFLLYRFWVFPARATQ